MVSIASVQMDWLVFCYVAYRVIWAMAWLGVAIGSIERTNSG